jgi:hypothetical protein
VLDAKTPKRLDLHLIVDNYRTHKHPVNEWLQAHPRFHLHFTPTSSSWLNLVERYFAEITRKRIRRGTFRKRQRAHLGDQRLRPPDQRGSEAVRVGREGKRHPQEGGEVSSDFRRGTLAPSGHLRERLRARACTNVPGD